ncbi:caspase family protein, partial [Allocoleopsis sp.]|uniref:caspase family protein n=1 Tax=Allocoleopsis sp. TaxID=3088169 RepID=UPI002FCEFCD3
ALAQPGGRKLALLVGINQYPRNMALSGCVTDVELQRELLLHRFGFKQQDILTLTDSQASRENIETAFVEHLTEQAKAGDVLVFHFSGYGSQVKMGQDSSSDGSVRLQNSLVPSDGIVQTNGAPVGNDLLEDTLVLLLRSLPTDHVTTILDTSYIGSSRVLQGNLRVRSSPNPPAEAPSPNELAFQEQIRLRTNPIGEKRFNTISPNQMAGIVLAAAGPSELATEGQWNGFSAGLFTYALTQHLWHALPATTIQISLSRAAGMVNQMVGTEQQPRVIHQKSQQSSLLAYYLPPDPSIGADGVVTAVEENGRTAQLWLAGLPATVLEYYGSNSIVSLYPNDSLPSVTGEGGQGSSLLSIPAPTSAQLQIRSKEGLTARARIMGFSVTDNYPLKVGQLVHEAVRLLPRNLGLTIALDVTLERIERVDATSAFAAIPPVSSVVIAGEQPADYVFGKVPLSTGAAPVAVSVPVDVATTRPEGMDGLGRTGGYGLLYLGSEPMRNTPGEAGEAVRSAVNRLIPKLETLLAAKLLRLTVNEGSSRLGIRASLEMVSPQGTVVMQRETWRASSPSSSPSKVFADNKKMSEFIAKVGEGNLPTVPIGSQIQYRLENYSDRPIYFMLLGMDTSGNAIALYHNQASQGSEDAENKPPLKNAVIAPGETLTLPQSSGSNWVIQEPAGLAEIQLICSQTPFTKSLMALDSARRKREGERIGDLFNPLEVARSVLQDLHNASAVAPELMGTTSDSYALDVNAWATLSFIYQVV